MNLTDDTPTIYCTKTNRIIDTCLTGQEAPDAKLARYMPEYGPDLVVIPFADAWQRHENAAKSEPSEITLEQWDYALNVLPPVSWFNDGASESFKISERLTGAITAIYVRLGERRFTFNDDIRTPHEECCRRVFHSQAYRQSSPTHKNETTCSLEETPER